MRGGDPGARGASSGLQLDAECLVKILVKILTILDENRELLGAPPFRPRGFPACATTSAARSMAMRGRSQNFKRFSRTNFEN